MREATPEQLARVLSVIVRLERFTDGTMVPFGAGSWRDAFAGRRSWRRG
jgi:hypothetical protein